VCNDRRDAGKPDELRVSVGKAATCGGTLVEEGMNIREAQLAGGPGALPPRERDLTDLAAIEVGERGDVARGMDDDLVAAIFAGHGRILVRHDADAPAGSVARSAGRP
jgi:hypothetical protein